MGWPEIVMIFVIVFVLFGAKNIPVMAQSLKAGERMDLSGTESAILWAMGAVMLALVLGTTLHFLHFDL